MAPSLFWIGLGNMGRGMVKNIVEKGHFASPVLIYNRTAQRAHDFSAKLASGKTTVVSSIEEGVAQADIIFICLADDAAVEGTASTLAPSVKGKLVVDCSTISPDTTTRVAEAILSAGGEFIACPVFGAPAMAEAGQLIAVPAGPKASVEKIRPYLTGVTSRGEIDMCDQPYSKALLLKVLGNTFILNMVEQLAEGHVAAEKTGLGTQYIHKFLELIFPGPYAAYSTRMLSGDYYKREEPLFAVDLARKDVRHGLDLAKGAGVRLMNLENADTHLVGVKEHMGAKGDIAGIYGAVRKESGLKFENGE